MNAPFDSAAAAQLLARAWRSGDLLAELPSTVRPATLAQGYDVQDCLIALLGHPVVGWKLGVGSALQKRHAGIGRSIAGRLLGPHLYAAGDTVPLPNDAPVTIEFEIAYVLGRDVLPDKPAFPAVEAIAEVRPAFELVRSRFIDRRAVGWPSFAADNAAFHALVLGMPIDLASEAELRRSLVVRVDGHEAARSLHGDDATDPVAALGDLVAVARERGMTLPKGSVISTGSVSEPFNCSASAAAISASFLGTEFGFRVEVAKPAQWLGGNNRHGQTGQSGRDPAA